MIEVTLDTRGPTRNVQLAALPCDTYHHYYHYQASAQYLWLGVTFAALHQQEAAAGAFKKAVFQDHGNREAIEMKSSVPNYDKHPIHDAEFVASIGECPTEATRLHDEGVAAQQAGDDARACALFGAAIAAGPEHSNSFFARGKLHFLKQEFEKARGDFEEAIRLSHLAHDRYHRHASQAHLGRGQEFLAGGHHELAANEFHKALDLWRGNEDAQMMLERPAVSET